LDLQTGLSFFLFFATHSESRLILLLKMSNKEFKNLNNANDGELKAALDSPQRGCGKGQHCVRNSRVPAWQMVCRKMALGDQREPPFRNMGFRNSRLQTQTLHQAFYLGRRILPLKNVWWGAETRAGILRSFT
jgi:hypothetical protein